MKLQNKVGPEAVKYWRVKGLLSALQFLLIPAAYVLLNFFTKEMDWPFWVLPLLIGLTVLFFIMEVLLLPSIREKTWYTDLQNDEIDFMKGIWIKKRTTIPMFRIQNIKTNVGPLTSKFHLRTVTVTTASGTHQLPEMNEEDAKHLQETVQMLIQNRSGQ